MAPWEESYKGSWAQNTQLRSPSQLNWLLGHNGGKGEWMSIGAYNKLSPGLDIFHPLPNLLLSAAPWNTCYYRKFPFYRLKHQGSEQLTHLQPAIQTLTPQAVVGDPEMPNFDRSLGNSHILKAKSKHKADVKLFPFCRGILSQRRWKGSCVQPQALKGAASGAHLTASACRESSTSSPWAPGERSQLSANHSFSNYLIYSWCLT